MKAAKQRKRHAPAKPSFAEFVTEYLKPWPILASFVANMVTPAEMNAFAALHDPERKGKK